MAEPRFLDQALFAQLSAQAAASPRLRQHHNFHQMDEPCHRMAVGLQPGTYIPPHRHLAADKAEIPKLVKPMIDGYVQRVSAQGLPGDKIIADVNKAKEKYEKQYKGK